MAVFANDASSTDLVRRQRQLLWPFLLNDIQTCRALIDISNEEKEMNCGAGCLYCIMAPFLLAGVGFLAGGIALASLGHGGEALSTIFTSFVFWGEKSEVRREKSVFI